MAGQGTPWRAVGAGGLACLVACGGAVVDDADVDAGADGPDASGADTSAPRADAGRPDATAPRDAGFAGDCVEECRRDHPAGYALDQKIDACWESKCRAECIDGTSTGVKDAGADAQCRNEVALEPPDPACELCTSVNCCAEWDGCFDNDACLDYEDCVFECP